MSGDHSEAPSTTSSWYYILATWFYSGKMPIAPGTFGTIAALPLCYLLIKMSNSLTELRIWFGLVLILLSIIGYIAICRYHKESGLIDHKSIVIDEVIGIVLTIALSYQWLIPVSIKLSQSHNPEKVIITLLIIATIVFRFFDIRKPFFIRTIEEALPNAMGVIIDDVIAAIYSSIVLYLVAKFYH